MPILVGIDGTGAAIFPGPKRDRKYDVNFANSFVRRLCDTGNANSLYLRGPVALGGGLVDAIKTGSRFIQNRRQSGVSEPVLLTGYSRGAAGVIVLARRLKRKSIQVRAMLLFDCVDRHLFIDAEVIPNNVEYVQHVVRDPKASSRGSFGNDGMKYSPPTVYPAAFAFMCTHGAMGGTPWVPKEGQSPSDIINEGGIDGKTQITFEEDARVSKLVWAFCQEFICTHGFA